MNSRIDKTALAQRIKNLDGLTADEKSALIGLLNSRKKYGLVWEEKEEAVEELLREKLPVLTEVKEKRIIAKDSDSAPDHILIEGDNLHALTALQYTHAGKIDLIEIDPPYNTGNKDFVYNDSFVDKDDTFRHSKWLCFMSKRLRLAKILLKENGAIFVHIDENESHNLRVLMDEIFGEANFIEQIVWNKRIPKNDKGIGNIHEYVLLYAKNYNSEHVFTQRKDGIEDVKELVQSLKKRKVPLPDAEKEVKKFYKKNGYDRGITLYNSFDENYKLWGKINVSWPNAKTFGPRYDILHPATHKPCKVPERGWRWIEETFKSMVDYKNAKLLHDGTYMCGQIWFAKDEKTQPSSIKYLDDVHELLLRSIISTKSDGADELFAIIGKSKFDHPKPLDLLNRLIDSTAAKDITILDFFAGSGTTLHATMALNTEDGGCRRCILVTNNESGICEEVTYERNKRVIEGYLSQDSEPVPGLTNNNLRYYKTDFIDREPTMKNRKALTRAAVDLLCIRENCYTPYKQLDTKEIRVFTSKQCELMIIFDPADIDTAIETIEKLYPGKKKRGTKPRCKVYVFSPGHYAYDEEFEPVIDKIELCALPEAIYRAYKAVLPKAKRKFLDEVEQEGAAS